MRTYGSSTLTDTTSGSLTLPLNTDDAGSPFRLALYAGIALYLKSSNECGLEMSDVMTLLGSDKHFES